MHEPPRLDPDRLHAFRARYVHDRGGSDVHIAWNGPGVPERAVEPASGFDAATPEWNRWTIRSAY
jgi:hypothetical protein